MPGTTLKRKPCADSACVLKEPSRGAKVASAYLIGVLRGEGIGPEVVGCALEVLAAISDRFGCQFEVESGGEIGIDAVRRHGAALSQEVIAFCGSVFDRGGAILAGPGGGRFVYEMRAEFDLFCKLSPLVPSPELAKSRPLKPVLADNADIIVVRDNAAGIYQGSGRRFTSDTQGQIAEHTFSYSEGVVRRIVQVACRIAQLRGREVAVVTKESGVPEVSSLWREVARSVARELGVGAHILEIDYAAYKIIRHARRWM